MNKIRFFVLLISTQSMLCSLTAACDPVTTAATTSATTTPTTTSKTTTATAATDGPTKKNIVRSDLSNIECSKLRKMDINFPAADNLKGTKASKGNARTTLCPKKKGIDNCSVNTTMLERCDGGSWKFIISSTYLKGVDTLSVIKPPETIFTKSPKNAAHNDSTAYVINSSKLNFIIVGKNLLKQAVVRIRMNVCCDVGESTPDLAF